MTMDKINVNTADNAVDVNHLLATTVGKIAAERMHKNGCEYIEIAGYTFLIPSKSNVPFLFVDNDGDFYNTVAKTVHVVNDTTFEVVEMVTTEVNLTKSVSLFNGEYQTKIPLLVVAHDFKTYVPIKRYSWVIMNPPVDDSVAYLSKALGLLNNGGELITTLDKKLIKSNSALLNTLIKYNADITPVEGTDLVVVYLQKLVETTSRILNAFTTDNTAGVELPETVAIMVNQYYAEIKAYYLMFELAAELKTAGACNPLLEKFEIDNYRNNINDVTEVCNRRYWGALVQLCVNNEILPVNATRYVLAIVARSVGINANATYTEFRNFEFSAVNVKKFLDNVANATREVLFKAAGVMIFERFGVYIHRKYKHPKYAIPYVGINGEEGVKLDGVMNSCRERSYDIAELETLCRCFTDNGVTSEQEIRDAMDNKSFGDKIQLRLFNVTLFKHAEARFKITDQKFLKRLNIAVGKRFGWLPEDYGVVEYDKLDAAGKAVVDSFEGAKSYADTRANELYKYPSITKTAC